MTLNHIIKGAFLQHGAGEKEKPQITQITQIFSVLFRVFRVFRGSFSQEFLMIPRPRPETYENHALNFSILL